MNRGGAGEKNTYRKKESNTNVVQATSDKWDWHSFEFFSGKKTNI